MSKPITKNNSSAVLLIAALLMLFYCAKFYNLSPYFIIVSSSVLLIMGGFKIYAKMNADAERKKWYIKIGIGVVFILFSIGYTLFKLKY